MSKQQTLYRIKLYRERYENFNQESRTKLKKNFDEKIAEQIKILKERYGHDFTEEDLKGIVANI